MPDWQSDRQRSDPRRCLPIQLLCPSCRPALLLKPPSVVAQAAVLGGADAAESVGRGRRRGRWDPSLPWAAGLSPDITRLKPERYPISATLMGLVCVGALQVGQMCVRCTTLAPRPWHRPPHLHRTAFGAVQAGQVCACAVQASPRGGAEWGCRRVPARLSTGAQRFPGARSCYCPLL
jgi:hypothetical protein